MSRSVIYVPSGSMCSKCAYAYADCSGLDFSKMQVIGSDSSNPGVEYKVVKCSAYDKALVGHTGEFLPKKGTEVR
jgi:hypothetical protein